MKRATKAAARVVRRAPNAGAAARKATAQSTVERGATGATAKRAPKKTGRSGAAAKRAPHDAGSRRVDERLRVLGGWRAATLGRIRALIHEADPDIVEDCKWAKASNPLGVPVWSHDGIVCTGESYKDLVKLTFARGAFIGDPHGLFNAGFGGGTRRAIDLREGELPDAGAFKELIRAAVGENRR